MGLGISVGFLADQIVHDPEGAEWVRKELEKLNVVLVENQLAAHKEPETLPELRFRGCQGFPYSFLHYLRRAYAFQAEGKPIPDGELNAEHDRVIEDAGSMLDSHLLCHSDAEGFYVPQDFMDPIFDDALPGAMLGSTQRLKLELQKVAPAIGIELSECEPSEATLEVLAEIEDEGAHYREKIVWLALWEACEASLEHNTLIVFG